MSISLYRPTPALASLAGRRRGRRDADSADSAPAEDGGACSRSAAAPRPASHDHCRAEPPSPMHPSCPPRTAAAPRPAPHSIPALPCPALRRAPSRCRLRLASPRRFLACTSGARPAQPHPASPPRPLRRAKCISLHRPPLPRWQAVPPPADTAGGGGGGDLMGGAAPTAHPPPPRGAGGAGGATPTPPTPPPPRIVVRVPAPPRRPARQCPLPAEPRLAEPPLSAAPRPCPPRPLSLRLNPHRLPSSHPSLPKPAPPSRTQPSPQRSSASRRAAPRLPPMCRAPVSSPGAAGQHRVREGG